MRLVMIWLSTCGYLSKSRELRLFVLETNTMDAATLHFAALMMLSANIPLIIDFLKSLVLGRAQYGAASSDTLSGIRSSMLCFESLMRQRGPLDID